MVYEFFFFNLRDRQHLGAHLLVHLPDACNSQGCDQQNPGARRSVRVSGVEWLGHSYLRLHLLCLTCASAGRGQWEQLEPQLWWREQASSWTSKMSQEQVEFLKSLPSFSIILHFHQLSEGLSCTWILKKNYSQINLKFHFLWTLWNHVLVFQEHFETQEDYSKDSE